MRGITLTDTLCVSGGGVQNFLHGIANKFLHNQVRFQIRNVIGVDSCG